MVFGCLSLASTLLVFPALFERLIELILYICLLCSCTSFYIILPKRFTTPTCKVCKLMDAEWEIASAIASPNIQFADIDGDTIEKLRDFLNVTAYPTLLIMKDGISFFIIESFLSYYITFPASRYCS